MYRLVCFCKVILAQITVAVSVLSLTVSIFGMRLNQDLPKWFEKMNRIKLLESSKSQVIDLFGEPDQDESEIGYIEYEYFGGELTFWFQENDGCGDIQGGRANGWNVPGGTITQIDFSSGEKEFRFDRADFEEFEPFSEKPIDNGKWGTALLSKNKQLEISVHEGKIQAVAFLPQENDPLVCGGGVRRGLIFHYCPPLTILRK